jgi:xanthine dehydrogenase YagT iron-sulfur-binding subunit
MDTPASAEILTDQWCFHRGLGIAPSKAFPLSERKNAAMNTSLLEHPANSAVLQERVPVRLTVNGQAHELQIEPWVTLLDLLREQFGLTGTKKGCDHGQCGACTVLIDGERINSCLALAVSKDGAQITTVEGLSNGEQLHPLQQAFIERDAFQCGYCTPGQLCSAQGLITEGHARTRAEVRELMSGNLCRCGAYTNISDAVLDVLAREEQP